MVVLIADLTRRWSHEFWQSFRTLQLPATIGTARVFWAGRRPS